MICIWLHLHNSEQHKLKTKIAFPMLILLKYIILSLDEGLLRNEKQTNNKNCFTGSRIGLANDKTGFIYPNLVAQMYRLPWAVLSTTEMLLHASSFYVSSPKPDQVL